jgi:hypothetical protein
VAEDGGGREKQTLVRDQSRENHQAAKLVFVQVTEPEERLFKKEPSDFGDTVTKGNGQDRYQSAAPASEMNNVVQEKAEAE